MTTLQFRRAVESDAGVLAAVYRNAYRENRDLGFPAKAESATRDEVGAWIRDHRVFVANANETCIGGVRLEVTAPDSVKLSRLAVRDDWKGEGVGSRLLEHAEDAVRDWGYETIWLTTPEEHPHLPEFYRSLGYEKTGQYPLEYREYDEIVMEKRVR